MLISLTVRVPKGFEKVVRSSPLVTAQDSARLRGAAFNLFGALSKFGSGYVADGFKEQLFLALPSYAAFVWDDDEDVRIVKGSCLWSLTRQACRRGLRQLAPMYKNPEFEVALVEALAEEVDVDEFFRSFAMAISKAFPERLFAIIEKFSTSLTNYRIWLQLVSITALGESSMLPR
jgi:hypothetical protein